MGICADAASIPIVHPQQAPARNQLNHYQQQQPGQYLAPTTAYTPASVNPFNNFVQNHNTNTQE